MVLSILYAQYHDLSVVKGLFYGLKPAVVAVVVEALLRISKRSLKNRWMVFIAAAAFVAILCFQVPFPLIIVAAGLIGYVGGKLWPDTFVIIKERVAQDGDANQHAISDDMAAAVRPSLGHALRTLVLWLSVWLLPVAALWTFAGRDSIYTQQALFFSKTAMVTFGGAYSVLAYIGQECVETYGWLTAGEMLDGLGMAETTPGPLIQVVQFVGFLGAFRNPAPLSPLWGGVAGAVITTWVTYTPCFLWIFLGAPYIEYLRGRKALNAALSTITAAVVGVILNLSIWFALHTMFGVVNEQQFGPMRLLVPSLPTIDLVAVAIAVAAMIAMFRYHVGMIPTLAASALSGLGYFLMMRV
jgi:chromate transporter